MVWFWRQIGYFCLECKWYEFFVEILRHWNKSKRQRIPNLKKKKSTKILTRQTLEYFTQRNDTFRSFWLKMKIYVCSLISNFINFYFDICFDWRKKKEHLVSNILTFDFVSQNRNSIHLSVTIVTKQTIFTWLLWNTHTHHNQLLQILFSVNNYCLKAQPFKIMQTKIKLKTSKGHAPKIFLQVYRNKWGVGWGLLKSKKMKRNLTIGCLCWIISNILKHYF